MSVTTPTVKLLWSRALNICAFPTCTQLLTQKAVNATTGDGFFTIVGEQAHIRSKRVGGPRYDPKYDVSLLDSYENLILLCPTHHTLIDANGGAEYTPEDLVAMRGKHEMRQQRRDRLERTMRAYVGQQYNQDDRVLFEQVDLHGPSVDSMFVDVPFACRSDLPIAGVLQGIAQVHPPERESLESAPGQVVTGSAQALLHPDWVGNALLVGGPGQGKSTLLQYICQFHRARMLGRTGYTGEEQSLADLTDVVRLPIRLDLRDYARWAVQSVNRVQSKGNRTPKSSQWPLLEQYIAAEVRRSTSQRFDLTDLSTLIGTQPVLIALDGLDEVADLEHRERVSNEIVDFEGRASADSARLVVLVATRPGGATSAMWSSPAFPRFNLLRLSHGLRLLYLRRWASVARLSAEAKEKLERTFVDNADVPHVRELASYPMQLAILLHLLHRRGLLPQRRTELYSEYLKTFLDREQNEDKEPLLATQREVIEGCLSFLGWHIQTDAEMGKSSGSIRRTQLQRLLREHLSGSQNSQKLADQIFTAFTSRVLCLVEREKDWFQFDVQSLREYFAATYIFDEGRRDARDEHFTAMLQRPYWSNVCRFYVGKYSPAEVRDITVLMEQLRTERDLRLHPMLRSMATLFLSDRTYERQKDAAMQSVVDFVLDGPGVIFAEDGLLDLSAGSALSLSDGAGRAQVVQHVKNRLSKEEDDSTRTALVTTLRRHADAETDLSGWWWSAYTKTWSWLQAASDLGIFTGMTRPQESATAELLLGNPSTTDWATALLVAGGYTGADNDLLGIVYDEINEGAIEVVDWTDRSSPVGRLLYGAFVALSRVGGNSPDAATRTRLRGKSHPTLLSSVVDATTRLSTPPEAEASSSVWQNRLVDIVQAWGDGWVLFQAVARLPMTLDLDTLEITVRSKEPELAARLKTEGEARANRGDVTWWRSRLTAATTDAAKREWLFAMVACANSQVVIDLASDVNDVVGALSPKYFSAVRASLRNFRGVGAGRQLILDEALRLNRVTLSARSLWLARVVSTDASVEQIDRRLTSGLGDLLNAEPGDLRDLVRVVDRSKKVPLPTFSGHRSALPSGGWASDINIGAMSTKLSNEILTRPSEWPSDLVQRAVQHVEKRMLSQVGTLAEVARANAWFDGDH